MLTGLSNGAHEYSLHVRLFLSFSKPFRVVLCSVQSHYARLVSFVSVVERHSKGQRSCVAGMLYPFTSNAAVWSGVRVVMEVV